MTGCNRRNGMLSLGGTRAGDSRGVLGSAGRTILRRLVGMMAVAGAVLLLAEGALGTGGTSGPGEGPPPGNQDDTPPAQGACGGAGPSSGGAGGVGSQSAGSLTASPLGAPPASANNVAVAQGSTNLFRGSMVEQTNDVSLPGPVFGWQHARTYDSRLVASSDGTDLAGDNGIRWQAASLGPYIHETSAGDIELYVDASTKRVFTNPQTVSGKTTYDAPKDYWAELEEKSLADSFDYDDDNNTSEEFGLFTLTERDTGNVYVFAGFETATGDHVRGRLLERTTRQYRAESKPGVEYSYWSTGSKRGLVKQVTTPQGSDVSYTYYARTDDAQLQMIVVKEDPQDENGFVKVEYTYYDDVNGSSDIGSDGDLVQVKVSSKASGDTGSSFSIVRYTQYRYYDSSDVNGKQHQLKIVLESNAIERIIADNSNISNADNILTRDDDYSSGSSTSSKIKDFATRLIEYYTLDLKTDNSGTGSPSDPECITPWDETSGEDLEGDYGGSNLVEYDADNGDGLVKTVTTNGSCANCSGAPGVKNTYFYMSLNGGSSTDPDDVVKIIIVDQEDSGSVARTRTIYGLNSDGVGLREAVVENPDASPLKAWCRSIVLNSDLRVAERRMPSAHKDDGSKGVSSKEDLTKFLDPTGNGGDNDTDTVSGANGVVYYYKYDSNFSDGKHPTGVLVRKGAGTEGREYISATNWGDGTNDKPKRLPVATYTFPTKTTRANGKETTYTYTFWDTDDTQLKTKIATLPTIDSTQNGAGSGNEATSEDYYDELGRLRWTKDSEGYVNYYSYHPDTGGQAYVGIDVDPTSVVNGADGANHDDTLWVKVSTDGASTNKPSSRGIGSETLPTALALITTHRYDAQGRGTLTIRNGYITSGSGSQHYTVYDDRESIQFPYWDSTNNKPLLPIQVTETDDGGNVQETYTVDPDRADQTGGVPTGLSSGTNQGHYQSWTRSFYDQINGQLVKGLRYHDIPASGDGTHITNYYVTANDYDALGRRTTTIETVDVNGSNVLEQITQNTLDVLGRVTAVKRATSGTSHNLGLDTGANATLGSLSLPSLATVAETVYDSGTVGDGHATSKKMYYGTGTSYIESIPKYTFRGHVRGIARTNGGTSFAPYSVMDIDWIGRTVGSAQYTSTPTWPTSYDDYIATHSSGRNDWTKTHHDDLGRVYKIDRYPGIMTSSHFQTKNYYDRNGRLVGTGDLYSAQQEMAYDGAGRRYQTRTVRELNSPHFSSGKFQYRNPDPNPVLTSMTSGDDKVIEVAHTVYDAGGNVTETHQFDVNHDDTDGMDLSNDDDYVRRSVYSWYDDAGRVTHQADYGTGNGTSSPSTWEYVAPASRPATHCDWDDSEVSNGYVLLTAYGYNSDSGRQETVTTGVSQNGSSTNTVSTKTFFDDLGRRIATAENYVNYSASDDSGAGGGTNNDEDRVTKWEYSGLGQVDKLTAVNITGSGEIDQETEYQYGNSYDATLVTEIEYPDIYTSNVNKVEMEYNLDGSLATRTDQRTVEMTYTYNNARQLELEAATDIPSGVDVTVKSIKRLYDTLGRVSTITSYADDDGTGTVHNQVKYTYRNYNRLYRLYQSQHGTVDSSTPRTEWVYDTSTASGIYNDGVRVSKVWHPAATSAQVVYYYGSADSRNDRLNRLSYHKLWGGSLNGNKNHTVYYEYNGISRVVEVRSSADNVQRRMFSSSGHYDSWDRFGRTVTQAWKRTSGTLLDQVDYTYDYAGNRLSRDIPSSLYSTNDQDQAYQYDGLQRLKHIDEGTWSGSAITSKKFAQDWTLDPLGNWPTFKEDANGNGSYTESSDLDQDRKHNKVNEIDNDEDHSNSPVSTITAGAGQANWVDPVYDAAGNTTTIPQPSSPTSSYTLKYDAWNRLVEVKSGSTVIASYEYDGLNRRIQKVVGNDTYDYYYNDKWQVLTVVKNSTAEAVYSWHPFYVDAVAVRMRASDQHFFFQDANFNVTAALDSSTNTVVERYRYTPYGVVQVMDASFGNRSSSTIANPYTYTGRRLDDETGLYYYRMRYYHAQLGRFVSRDPIEYEGSEWNLYEYAQSNPGVAVDPLGRSPFPIYIPPSSCYDPETALPRTAGHMRVFLKHALSLGCSQCKRCSKDFPGCNEVECKKEASRIADAIANTIRYNGNWFWYRFPIGGVNLGWPPLRRNQRYKGYWCWNWAAAFEQAVASQGILCFRAELHASGNANSGAMHWFTKIITCDGRAIYVDDSFWNGFFAHYTPPCGGAYEHWGKCELPEELQRPYPCPRAPD